MGSLKMAKPILCIAHPRACSTAFERVFMTRSHDLTCVHEPFGDAFYYGPERMGPRFEKDAAARTESGFAESDYKTILDQLESEGQEGKRIFIKDLSGYFMPPSGQEVEIAPSLQTKRRGIGTENSGVVSNGLLKTTGPPFPYGTEKEPGNPTVIPDEIWRKFHITFLIRDPHSSVPSYYRCTVPPLDKTTGFYNFDPAEMGYLEQRRLLDYFVAKGHISSKKSPASQNGDRGHTNGKNGYTNGTNGYMDHESPVEMCLVDADDLLDNPSAIIEEYCRCVKLDYSPSMLIWDTDEAKKRAVVLFEKWRGWHDDAIESKDLKPRAAHKKKKQRTEEQWDAEWKQKFGEEGAKIIRETVDANMEHYLYLKQFAMKI